jgi:hypothetical protein
MNSRLVGSGLLVAGVILATLGVVALATMVTPEATGASPPPAAATASGPAAVSEPSSVATPTPSPAATVTPTATPTPAPAETPSPTPSQADLIAAFMPQLAEALRTGDAAFQIAHLHPDTLARYGGAQCQRELPDLADPTVEITVFEIGPPEGWDYETDGLATRIEAAVPVTVDMTMEGVTARRVLHVTVDAGVVRWFTDCGLPTDTPAP